MDTKQIRNQITIALVSITFAISPVGVPKLFISADTVAQTNIKFQHKAVSPTTPEIVIPPLPQIGGGPTPDGTACCIYGMVWFNGVPVSGADVTIQSISGTVSLVTDEYGGITTSELRPFYQSSLYEPPLNAQVGTMITLTARYSGYSKIITHTVLEQEQQVDIAIPRTAPGVLGFTSDIRSTSNYTNLVSYPWRITSDRLGRIYVADIVAARIKVFDTNKTLLREWGDYGNQQSQFGTFGAIAVDRQDNILVMDGDNLRIGKFTSDGTPLSSFSLSCSGCPVFANTSIVVKPNNNILVNSSHVGAGQLAEFSSTGVLITSTNNGNVDNSSSVYGAGIDMDADGNLFVADPRNNRILKLDPVTRKPIAGDPWNSVTISNPIDVLVAPNNLIYVSRVIDTGAVIESYNISATFQHSISLSMLAPLDSTFVNGSLYIADGYGGKIVQVDAALTTSEIWIGRTNQQSLALSKPSGLAVVNDDVMVADCNQASVTRFRGSTVAKVWHADELGIDTGLTSCIMGLEQDNQGRFLTINSNLKKLHRFKLIGDAISVTKTFTITDANYPLRFAIGASNQTSNTIFMADIKAGRVLVYEIRDDLLVPVTATSVITGSGLGQFLEPSDVAVAPDDSIYVIDRSNYRLNKLRYQSGQLQYIGAYTATGTATPLVIPEGIGVSPLNGHVFIADFARSRIVEVDFTGTTGTFVRTYGENLSSHVAPGSVLSPIDVVIDNLGRMHVLQNGNVAPMIFTFSPITETHPVAAIAHVSLNAGLLNTSSVLTVTGIGQSNDISRTIVAYEWTFTSPFGLPDVVISTTTAQLEIPAKNLLPRIQFVSLRVQDSAGEWSPRATSNERIYVSSRPAIPSPTSTPTSEATPSSTPATPTPVSTCTTPTWLMMVYASADNPDDGQTLLKRLNEVVDGISNGKNSCVRIAIQIDGPTSLTSPNGDTRRWKGEPGRDFAEAPEIAEQAMDSVSSLHDFVKWAQGEFQDVQYHYLAITNHGQGIIGTVWDFTTDSPTHPGSNNGGYFLTAQEIAQALSAPDIIPIDIVHLDACSMGLLDVAFELRTAAKFLISSQYLGWAIFGYDEYLQDALQTTLPRTLADKIVRRYSSVTQQYNLPYTLSALDLSHVGEIKIAVDNLAVTLKGWISADPSRLERLLTLREDSQTFNSNSNLVNDPADVYIDLQDWALRIRDGFSNTLAEQDVHDKAAKLVVLLDSPSGFVVTNMQGNGALDPKLCTLGAACSINVSGAHGINVYYPPDALQPNATLTNRHIDSISANATDPGQVYDDYVNQRNFDFTKSSRWDEFLRIAHRSSRLPGIEDSLNPIAPQKLVTIVYLPLMHK